MIDRPETSELRARICALAERSRSELLIAPDGRRQRWLIDLRPLFLDAGALRMLADAAWTRLADASRPMQLAGMETAAIPLLAAMLLRAPDAELVHGLIIRKERKSTGLARAIEGEVNGAPVILIDDILNSADSAEKARVVLAEAGVALREMFVVIDFRSCRGLEWRERHGVTIHALFTLADLGLSLDSSLERRERVIALKEQHHFELLWRRKAGEPYPFYVVPKSAPLLADGKLMLGTDEAAFVALDAATGEERWRYAARGAHRKGIWSSAAAHAGRVYSGAYNGDLCCLDISTGVPAWTQNVCEWIGSSPLLLPQHDLLIVGLEYQRPAARGSMAAFRMSDGEKVWEYYLEQFQHGSASYWAEGDLAICGTNDHSVLALHARSGLPAWTVATKRSVKYAPRIDQERGLVAAASSDGNIYLLKAASGEHIAAFQTDNICYTTPLISHGRLYCGSADRHLHVVDLDSMTKVAAIDYGARIFASPRLIGSRVCFGTTGGVYREIDPVTLETLVRVQLPDAITNAPATSHDGSRIYLATYTNEVFALERSEGTGRGALQNTP